MRYVPENLWLGVLVLLAAVGLVSGEQGREAAQWAVAVFPSGAEYSLELARTDELFLNPKHPYTEALMSAVPVPDPDFRGEQITLTGDVPSPVNPPSGCTFHPRCNYAKNICKSEIPEYRNIGEEHFVTCHLADTLKLKSIQF